MSYVSLNRDVKHVIGTLVDGDNVASCALVFVVKKCRVDNSRKLIVAVGNSKLRALSQQFHTPSLSPDIKTPKWFMRPGFVFWKDAFLLLGFNGEAKHRYRIPLVVRD